MQLILFFLSLHDLKICYRGSYRRWAKGFRGEERRKLCSASQAEVCLVNRTAPLDVNTCLSNQGMGEPVTVEMLLDSRSHQPQSARLMLKDDGACIPTRSGRFPTHDLIYLSQWASPHLVAVDSIYQSGVVWRSISFCLFDLLPVFPLPFISNKASQ